MTDFLKIVQGDMSDELFEATTKAAAARIHAEIKREAEREATRAIEAAWHRNGIFHLTFCRLFGCVRSGDAA